MIQITTKSVEETKEFGAELAKVVNPGDLILLCGDLGAGKTSFTQGFGLGLGATCPITSPTFTLANCYEGDLVINHLDVYRLTHIEETRDLGLHELIDDQSVTLIEWGDVIAGALPCGYLEIRFNLGETSEERNVHLQIVGSEWEDRIESIEAIREKMC
ncbi:MAG: tRNA (adenosine(37)-N6)-threonylcarbamoyltransferase complex ATPase subunit type 1 TsaE [Actinobacteria bacterium]|nr:tRNA (adenosine(37)-N6)-threonylcarbamoyltransferase complex ATPase subunit type 1 TsaE [Actinomycetota bacterium]